MNNIKTIYAVSSGTGKAGVSVVRISGKEAIRTLKDLGMKSQPKARFAHLRMLHAKQDDNRAIDQALVLFFEGPHSFTGEDVVELHVHGSRAVVADLLQYLNSLDYLRAAEPGEFSRRAFLNDKLDLTQLEALGDLINADTQLQKRQALQQLEGKLQALYDGWRQELLKTMSLFEAYVDFPDEDIPQEQRQELQRKISTLLAEMQRHVGQKYGEKIRDGFTITLLGAPNAGKSSLLNALAQRDVAIVSDIAGTTRDIIEVQMDIAGIPVTICDTAGVRESRDFIEQQGVNRALERANRSDLICQIIDLNDPKQAEETTTTTIKVGTKLDIAENKAAIAACDIALSSTTGENMGALLDLIAEKLSHFEDSSEEPVLTRQRHRERVAATVERLQASINIINQIDNYELVAEELRLASRELSALIGKIDVEEVLGEIFSSFCIGK